MDMNLARVESLCKQVEFYAESGAVHGDIRHANLVAQGDNVVLIDAGAVQPIAGKLYSKDYHGTRHTASDVVYGSF